VDFHISEYLIRGIIEPGDSQIEMKSDLMSQI
jgi:hypothetical protein